MKKQKKKNNCFDSAILLLYVCVYKRSEKMRVAVVVVAYYN